MGNIISIHQIEIIKQLKELKRTKNSLIESMADYEEQPLLVSGIAQNINDINKQIEELSDRLIEE
jgi:hypothetical protein